MTQIIHRENYLARSYGDQSSENQNNWGYAELDSKPVNLYGPEIVEDFFTKAILEHLDLGKRKEINIFDIGAGDGRVGFEIDKSLVGVNPNFTLLEPSLSDKNSIISKKYHNSYYNQSHKVIPKSLENIQDWVKFNANSQDVTMSMFVIQYLANPQRVKLMLETQYQLLKPGGIAINFWVGGTDRTQSDWRTYLWLNIDKIRDPKIANESIDKLRKHWNQFSVQEFNEIVDRSDFKTVIPASEITRLKKPYNVEMLTNGSRFKPIEVQSQINAIRSAFQNTQDLYPSYFVDSSLNLPMIYSVLQKTK